MNGTSGGGTAGRRTGASTGRGSGSTAVRMAARLVLVPALTAAATLGMASVASAEEKTITWTSDPKSMVDLCNAGGGFGEMYKDGSGICLGKKGGSTYCKPPKAPNNCTSTPPEKLSRRKVERWWIATGFATLTAS